MGWGVVDSMRMLVVTVSSSEVVTAAANSSPPSPPSAPPLVGRAYTATMPLATATTTCRGRPPTEARGASTEGAMTLAAMSMAAVHDAVVVAVMVDVMPDAVMTMRW